MLEFKTEVSSQLLLPYKEANPIAVLANVFAFEQSCCTFLFYKHFAKLTVSCLTCSLCALVMSVLSGYIYWSYTLVIYTGYVCVWFEGLVCAKLAMFFLSGPHLGYLQSLYCQACTFTSCHQNACLTFPVSDHFIGHSTNLHRFLFLFIQSIIVIFILVNSVGFSIMPNMKTPYPDTTLCV